MFSFLYIFTRVTFSIFLSFMNCNFGALTKFWMENTTVECFLFFMLLVFTKATIVWFLSLMNCNYGALSKFWIENIPFNWHYKYYIRMFSFFHTLGLHKSNICVAFFFHELQFRSLRLILNGKYTIKLALQILHLNVFFSSCS